MKKNLLTLGLLLLSVTILGGCSSNQASSNQTQTTTKSESLVDSTKVSLKSAISLYQKTYPDSDITSIELDKTVGKPVYEIEGVDDNKEYKLSINAKNKKILPKITRTS
ncbi:PepSY domain-containing protein [Companilactobacillus halodurans]|uniref:PepSY domain-containing protein n=1 Tax=Companilactobacillus halodurans TaxID=2584183 RepID=UPI001386F3BF|nr:PepSY domain-containing protein [Companilactobacillus halodurans]